MSNDRQKPQPQKVNGTTRVLAGILGVICLGMSVLSFSEAFHSGTSTAETLFLAARVGAIGLVLVLASLVNIKG